MRNRILLTPGFAPRINKMHDGILACLPQREEETAASALANLSPALGFRDGDLSLVSRH